MRHGGVIGNTGDTNSLPGKCTECRLAAGSHAADDDINFLHADDVRFLAHELAYFGGGERSTFLGTGKPKGTG